MEKFFPRLPSEREVHARVRCRAEDKTLLAIKAELEKLNHADLRRLCKERNSFVQRQRRSLGHMFIVRDKVLPLSKQYPAKQTMSIFNRQAQRQESFRALEKTLGDKVVRRLDRKYAGDLLERRGNTSNDGEASKDDKDDISNYHTESTDYTHVICAERKLEPLTVDMKQSADMKDRLRQKSGTKTGQGQQFMNQDKHSRQNRGKHRFRVSVRERCFSDGDVIPTIPKMDCRLISRTYRSVWNKINSPKNPNDCDRYFKFSGAPTPSHEDRKETIPSVGDVMNFLTERSRRAHEIVKLPPLSCGSIEIARWSSPIVPRKPSELRPLRQYVSHRGTLVTSQHVSRSEQRHVKEVKSDSEVSPRESAAFKGPIRRQTVGAKPPRSWEFLPRELVANEKEREEMAKLKKIGVIRILYQHQRLLDNDVQRRVQNFLESDRK